jgi:hypothetical protein
VRPAVVGWGMGRAVRRWRRRAAGWRSSRQRRLHVRERPNERVELWRRNIGKQLVERAAQRALGRRECPLPKLSQGQLLSAAVPGP